MKFRDPKFVIFSLSFKLWCLRLVVRTHEFCALKIIIRVVVRTHEFCASKIIIRVVVRTHEFCASKIIIRVVVRTHEFCASKIIIGFLFDEIFVDPIPVDTGPKLNVHKTFRRRLACLLNVLCTFNLRPVLTGIDQKHLFKHAFTENNWKRFSIQNQVFI